MRLCLIAALSLVLGARVEEPRLFFWAGTGGDPATAGDGRWDLNDSVVWREGAPDGELVKWTDRRLAVFTGSAGGAIPIADPIALPGMRFATTAGPFTFTCSAGSIEVNGEGLTCDSPHPQTLVVRQASLSFNGHATAGGGPRGSSIQINSDSVTEFTDDATAGRAVLANAGEMHFMGRSSAAEATITNGSLLIFEDDARCGAAAIVNQGQIIVQENAGDFSTAALSNGDGGVLDVASVDPTKSVTFAALANGPGSALILGLKKLTARVLVLAGENDLNFDLAADASAQIHVTGLLLGNPGKPPTRLTITDAGGLAPGRTFTLLDWSAAAWVREVEVADFALQPLPGDLVGRLEIRDAKLLLHVAEKKRKPR